MSNVSYRATCMKKPNDIEKYDFLRALEVGKMIWMEVYLTESLVFFSARSNLIGRGELK